MTPPTTVSRYLDNIDGREEVQNVYKVPEELCTLSCLLCQCTLWPLRTSGAPEKGAELQEAGAVAQQQAGHQQGVVGACIPVLNHEYATCIVPLYS